MQIKKKYGKKIALALTLGIIIMGLGAVSVLSAEKAATLSFVTERSGEDYEAIVALAKKFEGQYPGIKIELSRIPYENFEEKLTTMIIGKQAPDIAWLMDRWIGVYGGMNAGLELTPYLPADYGANFASAMWAWALYDDKVIALPFMADGSVTGYNADYFKTAGLQAPGIGDEPWTWDELKTASTKLKEAQLPDLEYSMMFWVYSSPIRLNALYQNHGSILTEDLSAPAINSPESVEALKWMNSFYREGLAPETNFTSGHTDIRSYWAGGKIAMMPIFLSAFNSYEEAVGGRFAWNAMPMSYAKKPIKGGFFAPNALMVMNQTEYPEEAAQFIVWLTSREIMAEACSLTNYGPTRPDATELVESVGFRGEYRQIFLGTIQYMAAQLVREMRNPAWSEIDKKLRVETELMAMGQKSPEKLAEDSARLIEEILKKYK